MEDFKCPVCGGTLEISLLSCDAVCQACGNRSRVGYEQTAEYRRVVHEAEKLACLNTASGYTDAIELLASIPFVKEAGDKTQLYHKRLSELQSRRQAREEAEQESSRRETGFGVALIVLIVLIVLAALAVGAVLAVRLMRGEMSKQATVVIIAVAAVLVVGALIGKIRG